MIGRYNRKQIIVALLCFAGGLFCYYLTYLFFRHAPSWAAWQFGFRLSDKTSMMIAIAAVVIITWSGYRTWRAGGGLRGYHDSAFYHDLGEETGGAVAVDFYMHRVTGPAHIVSQVFLGGPLCLLQVGTRISSLIPNDRDLENRMTKTLELLRAINKWQSINDHPEMEREILYLAQIGKIDFSAAKGTPRIKAHLDD